MDCFIIGKARAKKFFEQISRSTLPGVYDWFVGEGDVLHVFFHVNGVRYLYREAAASDCSFSSDVAFYLGSDSVVEGLLRVEDELEPSLEEVSSADVASLWGDSFEVKNAYRR